MYKQRGRIWINGMHQPVTTFNVHYVPKRHIEGLNQNPNHK